MICRYAVPFCDLLFLCVCVCVFLNEILCSILEKVRIFPPFVACAFGLVSEKALSNEKVQRFVYSKNFVALAFLASSLIHMNLILYKVLFRIQFHSFE